jgi:hypothetical protein
MDETRRQEDLEAASAEAARSVPQAPVEPGGEEESLETIAERLGPFQPDNHLIEPEFEPSPPRPIPPRLRNGPFGLRFRRNTLAAIGAGLICLGFARTQMVHELAWYFLPLGYLTWIALGIIGLSVAKVVIQFIRPGPYAYVRDGVPVVARVLRVDYFIETIRVEGGRTSRFGFAVDIQHPEPESGQLICSQVRTATLGDANKAKRFTCPFQAGDHVTAVYLPGKFPKSLCLYALQGLNPDVPYIRKDGKPWQPGMSWFAACALVVGIMIGIWAIIALLASFQFYWPISGPTARHWMYFIPFAVVMGVLGSLAMRWLLRTEAANPNSIDPHKAGAWVAPLVGFVLVGCLFSTLVILYANAALDRSAPRYREIEVVELWEKTHDMVFREYTIEYIDRLSRNKDEHSARPNDLEDFAATRAGVMDIRQGFLGLAWIRQIHPVTVKPIPVDRLAGGEQAADGMETVEIADPRTKKPLRVAIVPVATTEQDETLPISKGLQEHALRSLRRSGALETIREMLRKSAESRPSGGTPGPVVR